MDDHRWYLGGLFDADGCVKIDKGGCLNVSVTQAQKGKEVLYKMQEMFGGSVLDKAAAKGNRQASFHWILNGHAARQFCVDMASFTYLRRIQLVAASQCPSRPRKVQIEATHVDSGETSQYNGIVDAVEAFARKGIKLHRGHVSDCICGRLRTTSKCAWKRLDDSGSSKKEELEVKQALAVDLREAKRRCHEEITTLIPVQYAAGFFDGDGCFGLSHRGHRHVVVQKYKPVCTAFQEVFGGYVNHRKTGHYVWEINKGAAAFVKQIAHYLIGKSKQAEIILKYDNMGIGLEDARNQIKRLTGFHHSKAHLKKI